MEKEALFAEVNERRRIRLENEAKKNENVNIVTVNGKTYDLLMPPKIEPKVETTTKPKLEFRPFYINEPLIEKPKIHNKVTLTENIIDVVVPPKKILTVEQYKILNDAIEEENNIRFLLEGDLSFEAVNKRRDARKKKEAIENEFFGSN